MKSKMTSKTWSWTLAAVLSISSLSFSSCSNNDENIVDTPHTAPAANQQTMKLSGNTWVRAYEAKGKAGAGSTADKNTDFSYIYVIDAYKFTEDGKGEFNRYFFDENDNLEVPDVVWGLQGSGHFTYSMKADGKVDITLSEDMKQAFPHQWTVELADTLINAKSIDGKDIQLERAPEGIKVILSDWNENSQKASTRGGNDNNAITQAIDDDVKDVKYSVLKEEDLSYAAILGNVAASAVRNTFIGDILRYLGVKNSSSQKAGTRAATISRHWEMHTGYYRCFSYTYESVDEVGKPITLSARIMWPKWAIFNLEEEPNNIMLVPHFTIMGEHECPSYGGCVESLVMSGDRILIMPDYIGYGVTKDRVHPYVNQNVCAQNSIDALRAGYKLFKEKAKVTLHKDWRLYVTGMSQGGGNTLAIHKWLDTHDEFAKNWRFEYSYSCAGPYNPKKTFEQYFAQKKHSYPVVLPATMKSMIASYPDVLGKWKEEDFYNESYLEIKAQVDEMMSSKEKTSSEINDVFFKHYPHKGEAGIKSGEEILITDVVCKDLMDPNSEMYNALMKCLADNDLTTGWTPKHPIYLFHGNADDIVPYENAKEVVKAFPGIASLTDAKGPANGHIGACAEYMGIVFANFW